LNILRKIFLNFDLLRGCSGNKLYSLISGGAWTKSGPKHANSKGGPLDLLFQRARKKIFPEKKNVGGDASLR
jgi:hypothetical protein